LSGIEVLYFDGRTSRGEFARLHIDVQARLFLEVGDHRASFPLADVAISSRLGNTPRVFQFPDGSRAETRDNDAVDRLLGDSYKGSWIHRLEFDRRIVVGSVIALVVLMWGMIELGVPWAANRLAHAIPPAADKTISEQTLAILDDRLLEPTRLSEEHQDRLRRVFDRMADGIDDRHDFRLEFRSSSAIGPNAFALPSGTILMLDGLVEIAEHDEEVHAVLAHEIGHVVGRHGLRSVLQDSAVVLLIGAITGDVVSTSSLASALPVVLVETRFSREFEQEADLFALDLMRREDIPPRRFHELLSRIEEVGGGDDALPGFLSTHPATEERGRKFVE